MGDKIPKKSRMTIVNNSMGIRQYVHRRYIKKKDAPTAVVNNVIVLKPGPNANVDPESWAHIDKDGSQARVDQEDNTIVPMDTHVDKIPARKMVDLIKSMTCIETAKLWLDETRNPKVKEVLMSRIKQMDHNESGSKKPETLLTGS